MSRSRVVMQMKDASVFYNGKPVLEGINREFHEGRVTGIIGPSGAGKTTLLRTLSRLNDRIPGFHVQGRVLVFGEEIYDNGVDVYELRRKVGMVFQTPCVFPRSIFENVIFGWKHLFPRRKREWPRVVEKTLRDVFLWDEVKDRLHKPAPTLSLGQQQRLAIARTLAIDPDILLMDEPTSALDPKSARAIEELVLCLKSRHTILVVTHNLSQAQRVSDDMVFLREGKVCESGASAEFFDRPCQWETREYLGGSGKPPNP
ncbi:MAG: phosphate ABC transporter ATP-binding protein [Nitrospinaceae bacterium]